MADGNSRSTLSLELQLQLERADRAQRDELVAGIARRMASQQRPREPKHTRTILQPLAFPVWSGDVACTCVVREYFLLSHPREHQVRTYWFPSIAAAKEAFPEARLLPDVPSVAPRLTAGRA